MADDGVRDLLTGAGLSALGAGLGRLMRLTVQMRGARQQMKWVDLVWEIPIVAGMAPVAAGLSDWLQLKDGGAIGLATALGYGGPRVIELILDRIGKGGREP